MGSPGVELGEIFDRDVGNVATFLSESMNSRVTPGSWAELLSPPWSSTGPNHGFLLRSGARIVGAYAAVYSDRVIGGESVRICNLAAFCVLDEFRAQSFRLLRAVLRQPGFEFTDLSPSGNVVALNERLGFVRLDTATRLAINLPALPQRGLSVTSEPAQLEAVLRSDDARIYADHRDARASRHLLVTSGEDWGYVLFRKDRRKGLPLFATPLHVGGDVRLVERGWATIASELLLRHRAPATLAEHRVLGFDPRASVPLTSPRPKMFRSTRLEAGDIDYLYSELTLLEW
jgi:hypothetical protein